MENIVERNIEEPLFLGRVKMKLIHTSLRGLAMVNIYRVVENSTSLSKDDYIVVRYEAGRDEFNNDTTIEVIERDVVDIINIDIHFRDKLHIDSIKTEKGAMYIKTSFTQ